MKNTCVEKIVINGAEKNITGQFEYDIKHKNIKKIQSYSFMALEKVTKMEQFIFPTGLFLKISK